MAVDGTKVWAAVRRRRLCVAMLVGLALSVTASIATGTPQKLPAVAMDAPLLFHVERAAALFVGFLLVAIVVARSWGGELPTEISGRGLKYATKEIQETTAESLTALSDAIAELRERQDRLEDSIDDLSS